MRRLLCVVAIVDVLAMSCAGGGQGLPPIPLPQDQTTAVITLDFRGGYGPDVEDDRPVLTIFANGLVRVVDHSGAVAPIEAKISIEALQDLLRFAIYEHHFFDFDEVTAERELELEAQKSDLRHYILDAATTVIHIRTAERDHGGEFYALSNYVEAYPAVKPLADFMSVQVRLLHLSHEIEAGGKEGITAALKVANEYLRKTYPRVPLLVPADFLYTSRDSPDRRRLIFVAKAAVRKQTEKDSAARVQRQMFPQPEFSVTVEYTTGNVPKITVDPRPQ